jgi:hypothetical protein
VQADTIILQHFYQKTQLKNDNFLLIMQKTRLFSKQILLKLHKKNTPQQNCCGVNI